jgi:hypothetical protein
LKVFWGREGRNPQELKNSGGNGEEDPPVLMPNTEVKLFSAENT